MNILDYTYDLHIIEEKFDTIGQGKEILSLRSFLESNPTKEEVIDRFINFLINLPELYDEEPTYNGDDFEEGFERGVDDGYGQGYKDGYAEGKTDGYDAGFEDARLIYEV